MCRSKILLSLQMVAIAIAAMVSSGVSAGYSVSGNTIYIDILPGQTIDNASSGVSAVFFATHRCSILGVAKTNCVDGDTVSIPGGFRGNFTFTVGGMIAGIPFTIPDHSITALPSATVGSVSPPRVYASSSPPLQVLGVGPPIVELCNATTNGTGVCYLRFRVTAPPNTAPSISSRAYSTNEDTARSVAPPISDPDSGDTHVYQIRSQPSQGSATLVSNNIRYTPPTNWHGTTSFQYRVRDAAGAYSPDRTITFTVDPVNDRPVATNASYSTPEDTAKNMSPSFSDVDAGDTHIYRVLSQPAQGSASISGGLIRYVPPNNWSGTTTFTYAVRDAAGWNSATRTITMTVTPTNDTPSVSNRSYTTPEDTARNVSPPISDVDSGDTHTYQVMSQPANGAAVVTGGQIRFTPNAHWAGTTSFTYRAKDQAGANSPTRTITFTVSPVNDQPSVSNRSYTTAEDITHNSTPAISDPDSGDAHTYVVLSQPANGAASVVANAIRFVPNTNWNGTTSFNYRVRDAAGSNSATRTITYTVTPVNDRPSVSNQSYTSSEDAVLNVAPPITDPDTGDTHTYVVVSQPANGNAAVVGGQIRYTPPANWSGVTSFNYAAKDAGGLQSITRQITVTVTPKNDVPSVTNQSYTTNEDTPIVVAPTITDADSGDTHTYVITQQPGSGTASIVGGGIQYSPLTNASGTVTFNYLARDALGAESPARTITVTVNPVNDVPSVSNESFTINEDTAHESEPVITDPDSGDTHTYLVKTQPANGSASVVSGRIRFVPAADWTGTTSFQFTATDQVGSESAPRLITYTVVSVSDAPIAQNIVITIDEGTQTDILAVFSDSDIGDTHTIENLSTPAQGVLTTLNPSVATGFNYSLVGNDWYGVINFLYRVTDSSSVVSNDANIRINVVPVNDVPITTNSSLTIAEDTSGSVTANVIDPDLGDTHTIDVTQPGQGSVVVVGQIMTYTPPADWNGSTSFTYRAMDSAGAYSAFSTVTVTVNPQNDPPVTGNLGMVIDEDTSGTRTVSITDSDSGDTHLVAVAMPPSQGSVSIAGNDITYTPPADWNGSTFFTFTVTDSGGESASASVNVTVLPINDAPLVNDLTINTIEESSGSAIVVVTDPDAGDTHTLSIVAAPADGSVSISGTTLVYQPAPNWNGVTTFTYQAADQLGTDSNVATVTVNVAPSNDAPSTGNLIETLDEDTSHEMTPAIFDPDTGDTYILKVIDSPTYGNVSISGGTMTYTPPANWYGLDSFTYVARDQGGLESNVSSVNLTINPVNDTPVVQDISRIIQEDENAVITVLIDDPDPSDSHTITIDSAPGSGSVTVAGNVMTFVPTANWNGVTTFTYSVTDSQGAVSNIATVTITGNGVNDAPSVPSNTLLTTPEDVPITHAVVVTDPDAGDTHTIEIVSAPLATEADVSISGMNIVYTPAPNWSGNHEVRYRVIDASGAASNVGFLTITVNSVNDNPIVNDLSIAVDEDTAGSATSIIQDADVGDTHTLAITTNTPFGTIVISGLDINFEPQPNWNGTTTVKYRAVDQNGGNSNIATVTITVNPVNDIPEISDETLTTNEDVSVLYTLPIIDPDSPESHTIILETLPDSGTAVISGDQILYTPPPSWSGATALTYRVEDSAGESSSIATLSVIVSGVNDAPSIGDESLTTSEDTAGSTVVSVSDDDAADTHTAEVVTPPAQGTVTISGLTVTYSPEPDWTGSTTFTYRVVDQVGAQSNVANFNVLVTPVNDRPVVMPVEINTLEDNSGTVDGVVNDVDSGDSYSLAILNQPSNGTVTLTGTTFTYTPDSDWYGTETFNYRAIDSGGLFASPAAVTVNVTPVNDAPTTADVAVNIDEDEDAIFDVTVIDPDSGDTHTIVIDVQPTEGTVVTLGTEVTFTPPPNWSGSTTFEYRVRDQVGAFSNTGHVTIGVNGVDDVPSVVDLTVSTDEDTPLTVPVTVVDGDLPSDSHSITIVGQPINGNVSVNGLDITYTPNSDWNGVDTLTFQVRDSTWLHSDTATMTIAVNPVNDNPSINPVTIDTQEDTSVTIEPTVYDVDDGDTSTYVIISQPAQGSVTLVSNQLIYTPPPNWWGTVDFNYRAFDQDNAYSNTETITVNVISVNDAPTIAPLSITLNEDEDATVTAVISDDDIGDTHTLSVVAQPIGGAVVVNGMDLTFTPDQDWNGTTIFSIQATDSLGMTSDVVEVNVIVNPINDRPTGTDSSLTTNEDTDGSIAVVVIDPDAGDPHHLVFVDLPGEGLALSSGNSITYTPKLNWWGETFLTYRIVDGENEQSEVYRLDITVLSVNDAPVAGDMDFVLDEDTSQTLAAPVSDIDIDDVLTIQTVTDPAFGSVTIEGNNITYTPFPNWFGSEQFTYQAVDLAGEVSNVATVRVDVNAINDIPSLASTASMEMDEDTTGSFYSIVTDVDTHTGDSHEITVTQQPENGTLSVSGLTVYFDPDPNWYGDTAFTYYVTDLAGAQSNESTVNVSVISINDLPSAHTVSISTPFGETATANVTPSDVDHDSGFVIELVTIGAGRMNVDGLTLNYKPAANWSGSTEFRYRVRDPEGGLSIPYRVYVNVESAGSANVLDRDLDVDQVRTFPVAELLSDSLDEPLSVIETDVINIATGEPAMGLANYEFSLHANADISVIIAGETVAPGESVMQTYDFNLHGSKVYIPIYPAEAGIIGEASFSIEFEDIVSWTQLYQYNGYRAWSDGTFADNCFEYIVPSATGKRYEGAIGSGVYRIHPSSAPSPIDVFCDMETDGGGWIVIQKRMNSGVSFDQDWNAYRDGFGPLSGDHWLGNDKISWITSSLGQQAYVRLVDKLNQETYEEYGSFAVSSGNYTLSVSAPSGPAGDSLSDHSGIAFSAGETDNDNSVTDCADIFASGWWFDACLESNLNGEAGTNTSGTPGYGIVWKTITGESETLRNSVIMLRPDNADVIHNW